jgi:signal transduction histidine kinase
MQERVRLAGGALILESAPGRGTQLQVSLPATER